MSLSETDTNRSDNHHKPPTPPAEPALIGKDQSETDIDDETVRKLYENMSCDEMVQCLAESHRQLSAVLGRQPSLSSASSHSQESDSTSDQGDPSQHGLGDDCNTEKQRMQNMFAQAASSGDVATATGLLQDPETRSYINIDAKDNDGTTPLIYAACFGKLEIVQALLAAGASIDIQDSFGWSALMWATNNNHNSVAKALLEHGASAQTKSAKGRTVFDFVNTDNQKMVDILATNPRDSFSSTSSIFMKLCHRDGSISLSSSSSNEAEYEFYYPSAVEGIDPLFVDGDEQHKLMHPSDDIASGGDKSSLVKEGSEETGDAHPANFEDDDETDDDAIQGFCWDKCLPHQMFVFADDDLEHILDTVISDVHLPLRLPSDIHVPANVVFLCARFAHYFSNPELLDAVLGGALDRVSNAIETNQGSLQGLSFWMTNCTQLLYYLRRDTAIVVATADSQLRLSELISEIYSFIVGDTERRLARVLGPSMLEYEAISGMEHVRFADDWNRFFRRGSTRRTKASLDGGSAVQMKRNASSPAGENGAGTGPMSPDALIRVFSDTLFVLQSYQIETSVVVQALAQFVHYISCELFNRILTNKKLLCRSKAMQIRMNLSRLEDWARQRHLPPSLILYLGPTTQLLQLLQCLSQLDDLATFANTAKTFDQLNALQLKRCVLSYRYEVDETRLPEEVEKYALQLAEDTLRSTQASPRLTSTTKASLPMTRTQSLSRSQRRDSMSSFVGSIMSSVGLAPSASLPTTLSASSSSPSLSKDDNMSNDTIKETKDSRFMLPFSVPKTITMTHGNGHSKQPHAVPTIPDDWMEKLDKRRSS